MATTTKVTNVGLAIVTNRMKGSGTEPKYVAWGTNTGATTAAVDDTALNAESAQESRTDGTSSRVTVTETNDTYQVVGTITCAIAAKGIKEVGLFDAATVGNLFLRSTFDVMNVDVGSSLEFTIKATATTS